MSEYEGFEHLKIELPTAVDDKGNVVECTCIW